MITSGIDHAVLAVSDLEAARAEFVSLGFQVTPGARHERFGTANHLCVFRSTYLELIAIRDPDPPDRTSIDVLAPCIARGGGLPMLALATNDAAASRQLLATRGVDAGEPVTWSRSADTPDGPRTASFTTMFTRSDLLPELAAFFCQHHTPQFVRCPAWQRHPNGAADLVGLEIHTRRPLTELATVLREHLGPEDVSETMDSVVVSLGNHRVTYRHAPSVNTRRLIVAVESLATAAALAGRRVEHAGDGTLRVKLTCAHDAELQFVEDLHKP